MWLYKNSQVLYKTIEVLSSWCVRVYCKATVNRGRYIFFTKNEYSGNCTPELKYLFFFFRTDTSFIFFPMHTGAKFNVMVPFAISQTSTTFLFLTPDLWFLYLKRKSPESWLNWTGDKRHPHQNFRITLIKNGWMLLFLSVAVTRPSALWSCTKYLWYSSCVSECTTDLHCLGTCPIMLSDIK